MNILSIVMVDIALQKSLQKFMTWVTSYTDVKNSEWKM